MDPPYVLPTVRRILGLPDGLMVRTVMALGHSVSDAARPSRVHSTGRLPRGETVHEERWRG
ncbi:hypothetical protein BH23CHL8_BH23CHL8_27980 [soil metagenome]